MANAITSGYVTVPNATGLQTITHNLGVTPKFAILFYGPQGTTTSGTVTANQNMMIAVTDGTTSACSSVNDLSGSSSNWLTHSSRIAGLFSSATIQSGTSSSQNGAALFSSWNTTTLVLNWTIAPPAGVLFYIIGGGPGIQAKVIFHANDTTTGNVSITGVGFQPDVLFQFGDAFSTAPTTSGSAGTACILNWGVMTPTASWTNAISANTDTASSQKTRHFGTTTLGAYMLATDAVTLVQSYSLVSMDTDGFTLNAQQAPASVTNSMNILAIRGVQAFAGSFAQITANGSQSITGVGFQPDMVIFSSVRDTTTNMTSPANPAVAEFGSYGNSGAGLGSFGIGEFINATANPSSSSSVLDTANIISRINATTVLDKAYGASLDTNGFTITWTRNSGTAYIHYYLALKALQSINETGLATTINSSSSFTGLWDTAYEANKSTTATSSTSVSAIRRGTESTSTTITSSTSFTAGIHSDAGLQSTTIANSFTAITAGFHLAELTKLTTITSTASLLDSIRRFTPVTPGIGAFVLVPQAATGFTQATPGTGSFVQVPKAGTSSDFTQATINSSSGAFTKT
jgi:hypothetical protein